MRVSDMLFLPLSPLASRRSPLFLFEILEQFRVELMPLQQLVEFRAIAFGEPRRLSDIAIGDPQDLREIIALELAPRVLE